jgi:spore maturation protein CgeB
MTRRAVLIGRDSPNVEGSYARALRSMGWTVEFFDLDRAIDRHTRFARAGRLFNAFVPIEAWVSKANRDLFVFIKERAPDLVIVSGSQRVRTGALAQVKVSSPATQLVLFWPDPLVHLENHTLAALPVFDLVASYSRDACPLLERLGARKTLWLPFAADLDVHPPDTDPSEEDRHRFATDVLFVGNYRPERERAVLALIDAGLKVKVYGSDLWRDGAVHRARVDSYWQRRLLVGREFVEASRCATVCLNVIDPGNYPAANMRFFENFAAGVPTVNSTCPEMESEFPNRVATLYFRDETSLIERVREAMRDAELRARIAREGAQRVRARHTYRDRAQSLVTELDL